MKRGMKHWELTAFSNGLQIPHETVDWSLLQAGSFVKKKLQKDVLYLMIVNLPTEEEKEARELDARLGDMMEQSEAGVP